MSSKQWKNGTNVGVRTLLAIAFIFSQSALAGQNQSNKSATQSEQKTASRQPNGMRPSGEQASRGVETLESSRAEGNLPDSGQHEGIKVHGHWTIEVRNPDGKVVTHREFENSLIPGTFLSSVLARAATVGTWSVVLTGTVCPFNEPDPNNPGSYINVPGNCFLQEVPAEGSLTVSASGNNVVVNGLLPGTSSAFSGSITGVGTYVFLCSPNSSPSSVSGLAQNSQFGCPASSSSPPPGFIGGEPQFTGTTLATPIQVSAGQTIAVTVNLSFS